MNPLNVKVTEAHIAEFTRRWHALDDGGDYDESKDRATALALQEALDALGVKAEARVYVYDEEPARIFIGDYFCHAPAVVEAHEYNGTIGPFDFTLFDEETWARHVPQDRLAATLNGETERVYTAYVSSDNALFDGFSEADAHACYLDDKTLDLVTLLEVGREPVDSGDAPGNGTTSGA